MFAAERHAAVKRMPAVDHRIAEDVLDDLPVRVVNGRLRVADVPIQSPVGAEHELVRGVIVLRAARLGEEQFLLVSLAVAVRVGEDEDVGRARDDDPVAEHADAHRRVDVAALVEDGRLVGPAVAVGVLQDEDAVAFGPFAVAVPIIDDFADPDAAAGIDVDVGGAEHHRLGGEERRLQTGSHVQSGERLRRRMLILREQRRSRNTRATLEPCTTKASRQRKLAGASTCDPAVHSEDTAEPKRLSSGTRSSRVQSAAGASIPVTSRSPRATDPTAPECGPD